MALAAVQQLLPSLQPQGPFQETESSLLTQGLSGLWAVLSCPLSVVLSKPLVWLILCLLTWFLCFSLYELGEPRDRVTVVSVSVSWRGLMGLVKCLVNEWFPFVSHCIHKCTQLHVVVVAGFPVLYNPRTLTPSVRLFFILNHKVARSVMVTLWVNHEGFQKHGLVGHRAFKELGRGQQPGVQRCEQENQPQSRWKASTHTWLWHTHCRMSSPAPCTWTCMCTRACNACTKRMKLWYAFEKALRVAVYDIYV